VFSKRSFPSINNSCTLARMAEEIMNEKIRSKKIQAELKVLRVNVQAGQEGLEAITSNMKT
jgi:hypothetical protein